MNCIEISGDHFTVGYHTGRWWARYFILNRERPAIKELLNKYDYFAYLGDSWDIRRNEHAPLLANTMRLYPEVIEEIAGIEKGAVEAFAELGEWLCPSFLDVFCLCLGETDDPDYNCTSAILKTKDGWVIGHNDEYTRRFPLLVAKVKLETPMGIRKLVSVSYPFQLLGAAVGMNESLVYANNSIGCKDQEEALWDTWHGRVPKTVLARRLLEARTIDEVDAIFGAKHWTLPNHYYVAAKETAWSFEIRPRLDVGDFPRLQVAKREIIDGIDHHTNHFMRSGQIDGEWLWEPRDLALSVARHEHLAEELANGKATPAKVKAILTRMATKHRRFAKRTAATILLSVNSSGTRLEGDFHFDEGFHTEYRITSKP